MVATVRELLRDYGAGRVSFDSVVRDFVLRKWPPRPVPAGDWGAVWDRAEEMPDDNSTDQIGLALASGWITEGERSRLWAAVNMAVRGR